MVFSVLTSGIPRVQDGRGADSAFEAFPAVWQASLLFQRALYRVAASQLHGQQHRQLRSQW